jgi:hypothetical protein
LSETPINFKELQVYVQAISGLLFGSTIARLIAGISFSYGEGKARLGGNRDWTFCLSGHPLVSTREGRATLSFHPLAAGDQELPELRAKAQP